jgi:hypothetical protein
MCFKNETTEILLTAMTILKNLLAATMTVAIVGVACLWWRFRTEERSIVAEFRSLVANIRSELNMSELTTIESNLLPSTTNTPSIISCCCGQLCSNDLPASQSKFFDFIRKDFDCEELWSNSAIDQSRTGPAVLMKNMPQKMLVNFTYNGLVPIRTFHMFDQAYLGGDADTPVWEADTVDDWSRRCANGTLDGNYGRQQTSYLLQGLKQVPTISTANVMVIGSENPWVEACVLSAGASNVTTLEFGKIESRHPRIVTLSPDEMRSRFSETYESFDVIVTFSSVEHAGLGRYGDRLNPWGDRQAIARAWCATKSGGYLVIGVPFGDDAIEYNAHRIYGKIMYPHLVANWYQQWRADGGFQRVHVLRKSMDGVTDPGMPADAGKFTWVSAALEGRLGNQMFIAASSFGIARARNANWCIHDFGGSDLDQSVLFTVPFPTLDCPAELEYTDELEGRANQRFVGSFMDGNGKGSVRVGTYLQSWMYFSASGVPFKLKEAEWAERWVQEGSFDVGIHVRADESGLQTLISFYVRAGPGNTKHFVGWH